MPEQNPDDLITTVELAAICGVSLPTVRVWRRMQYGPLPAKGGGVGNKLLWRRSTVETWWAANKPVLPPTYDPLSD